MKCSFYLSEVKKSKIPWVDRRKKFNRIA